MASFSQRLKELRVNKNLGQKEVGVIVGVSDSSIRKYETGERTPNPDALVKLADFFNVTVDYLIGVSDSKNAPELKTDKSTKKELPTKEEVTRKIIDMVSESGIIEKDFDAKEEEILLSYFKSSLEVYKNLRKK